MFRTTDSFEMDSSMRHCLRTPPGCNWHYKDLEAGGVTGSRSEGKLTAAHETALVISEAAWSSQKLLSTVILFPSTSTHPRNRHASDQDRPITVHREAPRVRLQHTGVLQSLIFLITQSPGTLPRLRKPPMDLY